MFSWDGWVGWFHPSTLYFLKWRTVDLKPQETPKNITASPRLFLDYCWCWTSGGWKVAKWNYCTDHRKRKNKSMRLIEDLQWPQFTVSSRDIKEESVTSSITEAAERISRVPPSFIVQCHEAPVTLVQRSKVSWDEIIVFCLIVYISTFGLWTFDLFLSIWSV